MKHKQLRCDRSNQGEIQTAVWDTNNDIQMQTIMMRYKDLLGNENYHDELSTTYSVVVKLKQFWWPISRVAGLSNFKFSVKNYFGCFS